MALDAVGNLSGGFKFLEFCSSPEEKALFTFLSGYRDEGLDPKFVAPTRHARTTCCSSINRYPEQTAHIRNLMQTRINAPLSILNIGVAQGQEPLTHINSAFEVAQTSGKKISDVVIVNRLDNNIKDVENKIYTRDLFARD